MSRGPLLVAIALSASIGRSALAADAEVKPPASEAPSGYLNLFSTLSFGEGLRFNNPYRLATELGADAESLSLTPAYADLGANITFGLPRGLQHGASVHAGGALAGTPQGYVNVSYILDYRGFASWMVHARIGPTFILSPDLNAGGELAAGFSYFFTGALGLTSEVAFDLFYGAGTLERDYSVIPTLSAQLGVIVDFEVLP